MTIRKSKKKKKKKMKMKKRKEGKEVNIANTAVRAIYVPFDSGAILRRKHVVYASLLACTPQRNRVTAAVTYVLKYVTTRSVGPNWVLIGP